MNINKRHIVNFILKNGNVHTENESKEWFFYQICLIND